MPKPHHKRLINRGYDRHRGSARARGYTTAWDKARKAYLAEHPLCRICQAQNHVRAATVVDHIIPHRGDQELFWDRTNWQPLCAEHHNRTKQRQELGTAPQAIGVDGWPIG